MKKIEDCRGNKLPIHVIAHCVGGLHIHMAVLGGYVPTSRIASLLCTNTSMFFSVTNLAWAKLILPLMPVILQLSTSNLARKESLSNKCLVEVKWAKNLRLKSSRRV